MFCPRCGRAVNETSNFCGGCGLSRAEIEKYIVKTQPETVQPQPEAAPEEARTVSWESQPAAEMPKAENEPCFAEKEIITEAAKETETAKAEKTTDAHQHTYTSAESSCAQNSSAQAEYRSAEPVKAEKSENLSTVDFIWMMIIAGIPVVGLIYLIVLAFQNDNTNKRSYARASLIISIFASIIGMVFVLGFLLSAI
ncbi:MAG: hypothetical protein IJN69_07400 [Oscillospiraceae bacterium]|nr:hypothetical protein [Oscillospiraceae bacterium]